MISISNNFLQGAPHQACSFGQPIPFAGLIPGACSYTQIVMRHFSDLVKLKSPALLCLLALLCGVSCKSPALTIDTCPNTPDDASGRVIGSILITETDCGKERKQNHHYVFEFASLPPSGLMTFLFGYHGDVYQLRPSLDSVSTYFTSLKKGDYMVRVYDEGWTGQRGITLREYVHVAGGRTAHLGQVSVQFPCWIKYNAEVEYSIAPLDSVSVNNIRRNCNSHR